MDVPRTLPARIYLTAYDTQRHKLTRTSRLHHLVRTAALEELTFAGHLRDNDGKVVAAGREWTGDPVLDGVLKSVRGSDRARNWKYWVRAHGGRTSDALRDQLAAQRVIRVERHRRLGLFPHNVVTVRDTRGVKALQQNAARALTGRTPATQLNQREVALAALAALGELDTVCRGSQRRENRGRIKELLALSGPAVPALQKVLAEDASEGEGSA
jgi:hypothetical protein